MIFFLKRFPITPPDYMLFINMRIYPITTTNTIANTNPTIAFKFVFFILLFFVVRTGFEPVIAFGIDDIRPIFM
jgi:hypothetical protein